MVYCVFLNCDLYIWIRTIYKTINFSSTYFQHNIKNSSIMWNLHRYFIILFIITYPTLWSIQGCPQNMRFIKFWGHCTALHCTSLHCTTLQCAALQCTALNCTTLYCTALCCTVVYMYPFVLKLCRYLIKNTNCWLY